MGRFLKPVEFLGLSRENALALGAVSAVYLFIVRFLLSNPADGTNVHLVLPGGMAVPWPDCPFQSVTGLPCPVCGFTRSSVMMLRGDFIGSFHAHPLGPIIVLSALVAVLAVPIILLTRGNRGSEYTGKTDERGAGRKVFSIILISLIVLAWIINIARAFGLILW
jgi:hypothetical protein